MSIHLITKYETSLKAINVLPLSRSRQQFLKQLQQNSPEWEEVRETLLGASELPQALGCSDYGSPSDLLAQKFGSRVQTAAMRRGSEQEIAAAQLYKKIYKEANGKEPKIKKPGMFAVPEAPFIAANHDYIQTAPELALVELKCVSKLPPAESIPDHYRYQVITQLAATKESIFSESGSTIPRAIIFVMGQKETYRQYEIVFDSDVEREWRTVIMPKAIRFYLHFMLPKIQARMSLSDLADTLPSPPRRRHALPTPGHVNDKMEMSLVSPALKVGKRVQRLGKNDVGVIRELNMDGKTAKVEWEGKIQQRMRPVTLESLAVCPIGDEPVVQPDRKGQEVMITGGSRKHLHYKKGVVVSISAHECKIALHEGSSSQEPVSVKLRNVAALDGARQVTVPPRSEPVIVEIDKLEEWIEQCQQENKVKLIGKIEVGKFVTEMKKKALQLESATQKASKRKRSASKK